MHIMFRSGMPTKYQQRKTTMGSVRKTKKPPRQSEVDKLFEVEESGVEKSESVTHGQTIKEEPASNAIANITANIAATSISMNNIDFTPIIQAEERTPEDTTGLVGAYCFFFFPNIMCIH